MNYPKNLKIRKTLLTLINKLLEKDYNLRISTSDESFNEYFNDNDMSESAFTMNRKKISKSTKQDFNSLKMNGIKRLLENLKVNNK